MYWLFLISATLIVLFTAFKIWEDGRRKLSRFSEFLSKQDYKVEKLILKVIVLWRSVKRYIRFIFFVRVPFFLHRTFRRVIYKTRDGYKRTTDYIRGKYLARRRGQTSSFYLKEISKIKNSGISDHAVALSFAEELKRKNDISIAPENIKEDQGTDLKSKESDTAKDEEESDVLENQVETEQKADEIVNENQQQKNENPNEPSDLGGYGESREKIIEEVEESETGPKSHVEGFTGTGVEEQIEEVDKTKFGSETSQEKSIKEEQEDKIIKPEAQTKEDPAKKEDSVVIKLKVEEQADEDKKVEASDKQNKTRRAKKPRVARAKKGGRKTSKKTKSRSSKVEVKEELN